MINAAILKKGCFVSLLTLWASYSFSSALSEISFVTALIFWSFWKISQKEWRLRAPKASLFLLLAFTFWTAVTILWSEAPPQSFRGFFKVIQQVLIFILVADSFREEKDFSWWKIVFLAMLILLAGDALVQGLTGRDFLRHIPAQDSGAGIRLSASFKTYGLLGCYLVLTLPVLLMITIRNFKFASITPKAITLLILYIACTTLLFFTKSRGALLAFIFGIFFLLIQAKKWRLLSLTGIILAGGLLVLPRSMLIHLDFEQKEQSIVERFYLWDRAVSVIKAKPFTGTGINSYAVAHQKYDTTNNWRVRNYYAHNGYLQMAAETGLPGLALFLAFFLVQQGWCFSLRPSRARNPCARDLDLFLASGLQAGVMSFMLFALFDTVLHNELPAMTFWYLLGLQSAHLWQHRKLLDHAC